MNQQLRNPPEIAAVAEPDVLRCLTALSQVQRLRAFRALVVAGSDGLTPGAMGALLDVAPSALSFHLKELTHSGMASVEQRGRNLIYRADFARMSALLAYLGEHCCAAQATPDAAPCAPGLGGGSCAKSD